MKKGQKIKKLSLDSIDNNIISEMIKNANIGTPDLSRKFKVPLSTIQRRRRTLENSILKKKYEINHNEVGWRAGDLIILVEKGKTTEVMEHILKNYWANNVMSISTRINSMHNIIARVVYHDSEDLNALLEHVKATPYVVTSEWSEIVKVVENSKLTLRF
jgi:DNA-binding Lrp family transcriptional regulator